MSYVTVYWFKFYALKLHPVKMNSFKELMYFVKRFHVLHCSVVLKLENRKPLKFNAVLCFS